METKKRHNVMLRPKIREAIKIIGKGNLSAGIETLYIRFTNQEKSKK